MRGIFSPPAYGDGIKKKEQVEFGGLDMRQSASNGAISGMTNISAADYPIISPRRKRSLITTLSVPNGIYGYDGIIYVDGTSLYDGGVKRGTVQNSYKRFCALGANIMILPDKAVYNRINHTLSPVELTYTGTAGQISFSDGTYAGVAAEGCCLVTSGAAFGFSVGDAVTISGCTSLQDNNKSVIIREISDGGRKLTCYENTFTVGSEAGAVTVSRTMPDLDFICENENRLWGCKGDTVYACKLGDPFNWNVFDGLSTDSYAVDVGSPGDFTGCVSYKGYPCFFKEKYVYKMYGSKPSAFQLMGSASTGILEGSSYSPAVAGETLFYLSPSGIVSYTGGTPRSRSGVFGDEKFTEAVGGADGKVYYVSAHNGADEWKLYTYDAEKGIWCCEDELHALGFAYDKGLYCLDSFGRLWFFDGTGDAPSGSTAEEGFTSEVVFAPFYEDTLNRKGLSRLQLRVQLEDGASMRLYISYDGGEYTLKRTESSSGRKMLNIPLVPRRCDFWNIKIVLTGKWRIFGLTREFYTGSEI